MSQINKICCACGIQKPIKNFYVNNSVPAGYDSRCKLCKLNKNRCRALKGEKKVVQKRIDLFPYIANPTKKDWIEMYEFLVKIGYDLKENIHIQLCKKYNLQPRVRMKEKSKQYSPSELGLV